MVEATSLSGTVTDPADHERSKLRTLGLVGSLGMIVGLLLPWATITSCQCEGDATTTYLTAFRSTWSYAGGDPRNPLQLQLGVIIFVVVALAALSVGLRYLMAANQKPWHRRLVLMLCVAMLFLGLLTLYGEPYLLGSTNGSRPLFGTILWGGAYANRSLWGACMFMIGAAAITFAVARGGAREERRGAEELRNT